MTPVLVDLLAVAGTGEPLSIAPDAVRDVHGRVVTGSLVAPSGVRVRILRGIPRFAGQPGVSCEGVRSFGDEWKLQLHGLPVPLAGAHGRAYLRIACRFPGSVDCGCWWWQWRTGAVDARERARHVIVLELSHAVDGVMREDLDSSGYHNYGIVQCSIDAPPVH